MHPLENSPEVFWIIQITNPLGKKGYAIETPEGLRFAVGGFDANSKQFTSKDAAGHFVVDIDLYKLGKISILSNVDISKMYGAPTKNKLWVVVNERGHHLFFDNGTQKYYFEDRQIGCVAFETKNHVDRFIDYRQREFPFDTLIAKQLENKKVG